jgi:tRNA(Ile)-lysidine synthase
VRANSGEYLSGVPTQSEAVTAVQRSLAAMPAGRWLLAVSGGRDSMVLLDAMAAARASEVAAVATFDHGTGAAATRAAGLVERVALGRQLPVVSGVGPAISGEAAWRDARWRFLRGWAAELGATIVTAHTRDDQVETVLLRLLRDAGPRGLAGMLAPSSVARPLLMVSRAEVAVYATARAVAYVEDPSNASRAHARNRVRLDLLPALERAQPGFSAWCWALGDRAAAWRAEVAGLVDAALAPTVVGRGTVVVAAEAVADLDADAWGVLWPEIAARAGVRLDRRGVVRAAAWAPTAAPGSQIPVAGGAVIARTGRTFVVRQLY